MKSDRYNDPAMHRDDAGGVQGSPSPRASGPRRAPTTGVGPAPAASAAVMVLAAGFMLGSGLPRAGVAAPSDDRVDFNADIRPVLSNNCFKCHGPDEAKAEGGLRLDTFEHATAPTRKGHRAIVPGKPGESALIARVSSKDDDERMPPPEMHKRVTPDEIAALSRWIEQGAEYKPHWSLVAPVRHEPPAVKDPAWCRNFIDPFVLARLEKEGLTPSPEADKETLLRRVSFDLTGLPPTPSEIDEFLADTGESAYEHVVDRLLASSAYGERWARVWLDLARFADTRGYEKDDRRTIWPYRDWVIRAFNSDMTFDQFTIRQIAGDLVEHPTDDDIVATAFHRNTMNNDEGGTDDEEFRNAAVVDRVNTTMQVWMGVTMGCAQCHSHKYDPISNTEYYRFFAFFDQSQDADQPDESPTFAVASKDERARLDSLEAALRDRENAVADEAAGLAASDAGRTSDAPANDGGETILSWLDDVLPIGARVPGDSQPWRFVEGDVRSGSRAWVGEAPAGEVRQHFFRDARETLTIAPGDTIIVDAKPDAAGAPTQIMLQFLVGPNDWEHRAYWGENTITWGVDGTVSRRRMGDVPPAGRWTRLEIKPEDVGLAPGTTLIGVAFSQVGGSVLYDRLALTTSRPAGTEYRRSQDAWESWALANPAASPDDVNAILKSEKSSRTPEQVARLREYFIAEVHEASRVALERVAQARDEARRALDSARAMLPSIPVMRERPPDQRRVTRIHLKGSFLDLGDPVEPGVPAAYGKMREGEPMNRLGLAHWLIDRANPLTARVAVNRWWEQFFGTGIVETVEDFGSQAPMPSHPDLLDTLAVEFMDRGWSMKRLCKAIVMSAAYRQSSVARRECVERDARNRLLWRGPRFRLDAEMIRDSALAAAGLLSGKMYGPSVFPRQPDGIWAMPYNGDSWVLSRGEDRFRRGLYTFIRRTAPYPSMMTFDAGSRESCLPRRIRTNTPLQALTTLNDPVYVEAAQGLARRAARESGAEPRERAASMIKLVMGRRPRDGEVDRLVALYASEFAHYTGNPDDALKMATDPLGPLPDGAGAPELAAWTVVANVVLNLDEALTKN